MATTTARGRRAAGITLALAAVAAFALVLVLRQDPPTRAADPGPAAAEQHIRDYVAALNSGEPARVAALVGRPADSPQVTDVLDRLGGRGLTDVAVRVREDFSNVYLVWVDATATDGTPVHLYEQMEWTDDRWWLALASG